MRHSLTLKPLANKDVGGNLHLSKENLKLFQLKLFLLFAPVIKNKADDENFF